MSAKVSNVAFFPTKAAMGCQNYDSLFADPPTMRPNIFNADKLLLF